MFSCCVALMWEHVAGFTSSCDKQDIKKGSNCSLAECWDVTLQTEVTKGMHPITGNRVQEKSSTWTIDAGQQSKKV